MSFRALWPWLLVGALLASAYANLTWYWSMQTPTNASARLGSLDPGAIPSFHLAPGSSGERCPTLDRLELTRAQRDRIRECSLTSLDVRTDLAIEIHRTSTELQQLLAKDAIDSARILELANQISDARSRQYKTWIASILVVRDVLTREQLQLLHQLESN